MKIHANNIYNEKIRFKYFRHRESERQIGPDSEIQNNSIQKPLQENKVSFKGFNLSKITQQNVSVMPQKLKDFTLSIVKEINEEHYTKYLKYIDDYTKTQTHKNFVSNLQKMNKNLTNINEKDIILSKHDKATMRFAKACISPFTAIYNIYKPIVKTKFGQKMFPKTYIKIQEQMRVEEIEKNFKAFEGLTQSIKIWENGYRKYTGNKAWNQNDDFIIPRDVVNQKIVRRRLKSVDPDKAKYSSKNYVLGIRLVSGVMASIYLSNDAYNTTMRFSNNKKEAEAQKYSRFMQEASRVTLSMYIQNLLFSTFEKFVNNSLKNALFISAMTVLSSEMLGRTLVGKPILPSTKEKLDEKENKMEEKKGILPAIGRMLTRSTKKIEPENKLKKIENSSEPKSQAELNPNFRATPSFKGFYNVNKVINKNQLKKILFLLKKADIEEYNHYEKIIQKGFKYVKTHEGKNISQYSINDALENLETVPVGTKHTIHGKITKSILFQGFFEGVANGCKNIYSKIIGKKITNEERISQVMKQNNISKEDFETGFAKYKNKRLNNEAWKISPLTLNEKEDRILNEFLDNITKDKEAIDGVKNVILQLAKHIELKKIDPNNLKQKDINTVKQIMTKNMLTADCAKDIEYDGNLFAQLNVNVSRAITTLFLVTDAYNLTMQYSNNNKKESTTSARNRTAQEISRIGVTAYILAFVHNLLSKVNNSSLLGAWGLCAVTSNINEILSRKVVGVPITTKSYQELQEIDKKMQISKSPLRRALAYSLGKKVPPAQSQSIKPLDDNILKQNIVYNNQAKNTFEKFITIDKL